MEKALRICKRRRLLEVCVVTSMMVVLLTIIWLSRDELRGASTTARPSQATQITPLADAMPLSAYLVQSCSFKIQRETGDATWTPARKVTSLGASQDGHLMADTGDGLPPGQVVLLTCAVPAGSSNKQSDGEGAARLKEVQ